MYCKKYSVPFALLLFGAATAAAQTAGDVPCQSPQALGDVDRADGARLETRFGGMHPLLPGQTLYVPTDALVTAGTGAEVLRRQACAAGTVIVGRVNTRRFLAAPEGRLVFATHEVQVEEILANRAAATVTVGERITAVRAGGAVCAEGSAVRTVADTQAPLAEGGRHVLFLRYVSATGSYETSNGDLLLGEDGSVRRLVSENEVVDPVNALAADAALAALRGASCE